MPRLSSRNVFSVPLKMYASGKSASGIRAEGFLRRKGCRTSCIGRLAGKEVHSKRVMKEGARGRRGNDTIEPPNLSRRAVSRDPDPRIRGHSALPFIQQIDLMHGPKKTKLKVSLNQS